MQFTSQKISGDGRGKLLGFPTINLVIPPGLSLEEGIYAVWIWLDQKKYPGALHYGPIPTFHKPQLSLEVFVLTTDELPNEQVEQAKITVEPVKRLRPVQNFPDSEALIKQITIDVAAVRKLLSLKS
jgi:riboflavin kinase/FMN adenylyltransferase